jgi:hypothetical protein
MLLKPKSWAISYCPLAGKNQSNRIKLLINLFNYNKPASCGYRRSFMASSCDDSRNFLTNTLHQLTKTLAQSSYINHVISISSETSIEQKDLSLRYGR